MTDSEALSDRDARLADATTPAQRAEILGLDWPRLTTALRTAMLALVGLVILSAVAIAPVASAFTTFGRGSASDPNDVISLWSPLVAYLPFLLAYCVTQAILRVGRRWSTVRQQVLAISARAIVGTLGLGVVAVLLRDEPGAVTAVLMAGALRGWLALASAISVPLSLRRGSKLLGFVVDQNRTLPVGTTIIDGRVAPVFAWALVHTVTGIVVAALVWLTPPLAPVVAIVLAAVELGEARLRFAGRNALALGIAWAFTGVLGAAVILTF